jgi:hypothetical protein
MPVVKSFTVSDHDLKETIDTLLARAYRLQYMFSPVPGKISAVAQRKHAAQKCNSILAVALKLYIGAGQPKFNDADIDKAVDDMLKPLIAPSDVSKALHDQPIEIDGKLYKRLSLDAFKEFTKYSDYDIAHPECSPRKFYYTLSEVVKDERLYKDWLGRPITRFEKRDPLIDDSIRPGYVRAEGAEAVWYPDGKVFYFDNWVYEPCETNAV